jgi:hypothetical protein
MFTMGFYAAFVIGVLAATPLELLDEVNLHT